MKYLGFLSVLMLFVSAHSNAQSLTGKIGSKIREGNILKLNNEDLSLTGSCHCLTPEFRSGRDQSSAVSITLELYESSERIDNLEIIEACENLTGRAFKSTVNTFSRGAKPKSETDAVILMSCKPEVELISER